MDQPVSDLNTQPAAPMASPTAPVSLKPEAAVVLRQFRVVFNAVKTHFQHVERQAGVGGAQLWALSVVAGHPGIGVGELALKMDIHQSTTRSEEHTSELQSQS